MKSTLRIVTKYLAGIGLLLAGQSALADSQCPDGQFNPNQTVCMCPNGGYVGPGERCSRGGGGVTVLPVPKTWGAIAIDMSKAQKSGGFASSTQSQSDANREALKICGLSTCKIALAYQNSCGAITKNRNGIWGGGINVNEDKAMQEAADACYDKGAKDCYKWVTPKCAAAPR